MAVEHLEQVFEEGLDRIYYIEQRLVKMLDKMARNAADDKIRMAFESHRMETIGQIRRIDEIFVMLDMEPKRVPAHEIDGLQADENEFSKERPSDAIKDFHALAAAIKIENLEIGHYEILIMLAKKLYFGEISSLLKENLREEERALKKTLKLSKKFDFTRAIIPEVEGIV